MTLQDTQTLLTRAERLRAATHSTHERLDAAIMAAQPFASVDNYLRFLRLQHGFHRDVAPLYGDPVLNALIPSLDRLGRLGAVTRDLADLGRAPPVYSSPPAAPRTASAALGWLYVVEGSNLGAAFLLKAARKMGLSEGRGASHMAEAPEGRAAHWRSFKEALNGAALTAAEEEQLVVGANAAFARVRALAAQHLE
ncbi:biliverdin-producing heme oxygenase [Cereibacter changlensis JA139]|uniref:Biliverdin-producing heme oxygenase n=2 Tax=Cereibacter changlensis TaxID=402884 RepID=A0A2T4JQG5_9RHOB|nr:biliverdin-producing heme oxygenase [Cereibacter changlensis]PTE20160.1 biliverdin-producing heme oxygenase [Cereibacter changlensis JA139]PZX46891.1 heme oxygenase [Cereibacter changlensis]